MSQPFSGMPNPGAPRPFKRRFQPRMVQETLQAVRRGSEEGLRRARRYGADLWLRGKRNPRTFGLIGAAVVLTLGGAYALSASGAERSLCPPAGKASSTPRFHLLMDRVPHPAAGSQVEIHYDVCGLSSGTHYRGRVRLSQQQAEGKKKKKKKGAAKPKPLVVSFQDKVDGPATRRHQQLNLGATRPGAYTLELFVVDNQGRERKRVQKVLVRAPQP
jgi:hypothetical protein